MTGFIRGLFGRKNQEAAQPTGDYFLDSDSAKTLGNVEFMRKRNKIRHTFRTMGESGEEIETIAEISSLEKREMAETEAPQASMSQPSFEPKKPDIKPTASSDGSSSNMDFFRKLAKDINRR